MKQQCFGRWSPPRLCSTSHIRFALWTVVGSEARIPLWSLAQPGGDLLERCEWIRSTECLEQWLAQSLHVINGSYYLLYIGQFCFLCSPWIKFSNGYQGFLIRNGGDEIKSMPDWTMCLMHTVFLKNCFYECFWNFLIFFLSFTKRGEKSNTFHL